MCWKKCDASGFKKLLRESMDAQDYECQMLIMAKVVKFLRREILSSKSSPFTGNFLPECQNQSVPAALKLFVSMLFDGYQKKEQCMSQASLTISSLYTSVQFYCYKCISFQRTRASFTLLLGLEYSYPDKK